MAFEKKQTDLADLNSGLSILGLHFLSFWICNISATNYAGKLKFWIYNPLKIIFTEILLFNDFQNPHDPKFSDS